MSDSSSTPLTGSSPVGSLAARESAEDASAKAVQAWQELHGRPAPEWVGRKAAMDFYDDGGGLWSFRGAPTYEAEFMAWAREKMGQGYSLAICEGRFVDHVTDYAYAGYVAGMAQSQCATPKPMPDVAWMMKGPFPMSTPALRYQDRISNRLATVGGKTRWDATAIAAEADAEIRGLVERIAALTAERDALLETQRKFGTLQHALMEERDALRKDAERLDWAEAHPLEFMTLVLGECPDDTDSLPVYSKLTGRILPSGAHELAPARWDMRTAIDAALATPVPPK